MRFSRYARLSAWKSAPSWWAGVSAPVLGGSVNDMISLLDGGWRRVERARRGHRAYSRYER
ncbi:hypothetical protein EBESD8_2360 [Rhodococcus aetherivorans]|nr:hypothetical protein EBESD8_2360 [Rhodococcus aetherivorans]